MIDCCERSAFLGIPRRTSEQCSEYPAAKPDAFSCLTRFGSWSEPVRLWTSSKHQRAEVTPIKVHASGNDRPNFCN